MKYPACLMVAVALALTSVASARVQTVPPAAAAADDRPDFSGTWSLDTSISNDPARANFEPNGQQRGQRSSGFGGGSSRRGRLGGLGGARPARETARASTPDPRLQLLTELLKKSSTSLVVSHHDPNFVINDAQDHTLFFQTDGSPEENHLGSVTLTSTTHWDGPRLVTEYALVNRTLIYTYTMLPATKQVVLRVRLEAAERQRADGPELKLVYNLAPSEPR